mmetsp:Transcript_23844/g.48278  ORF Transcript_23844/g.48278 Transcript_23844/m.48278 type:complete len:319 (-) Transcript_23844:72-1028(-)
MHFVVICVLRIGNLGVLPPPLVLWVGDHLGRPRSIVLRVVHHRRLPLAIILIIPVIRLRCIRVGDLLRDVVISLRFHILRINDLPLINPVIGLGLLRILDLLGGEEVELVLELARADRLVVDKDLESVVGTDNKGVEVGELVILTRNLLLDEEVVSLLLIVEDGVGLLVRATADVGTEHDSVFCVTSELGACEGIASGEKLDVCTSAVDALLMLHRVLDDEVLAVRGVEHLVHLGRDAKESSVRAGLNALVGLIAVPLARSVLPLAHLSSRFPVGRLRPAVLPAVVIELLLEVDLRGSGDGGEGERGEGRDSHFSFFC